MKICLTCKIQKDKCDFAKSKNCKEGLRPHCRLCYNNYQNNYQKIYGPSYYKNKRKTDKEYHEKELEKKRRWRLNPKNRKKEEEYRLINRDKINSFCRDWNKRNRERKRVNDNNWRKNNPEKNKAIIKRSNQKKLLNPVTNLEMRIRCLVSYHLKNLNRRKCKKTFTLLGRPSSDYTTHLLSFLENPCTSCGTIILNLKNSHLDHIIPMCSSKNEEDVVRLNDISNLRMICKKCNLNKISSDLKFSWRKNE